MPTDEGEECDFKKASDKTVANDSVKMAIRDEPKILVVAVVAGVVGRGIGDWNTAIAFASGAVCLGLAIAYPKTRLALAVIGVSLPIVLLLYPALRESLATRDAPRDSRVRPPEPSGPGKSDAPAPPDKDRSSSKQPEEKAKDQGATGAASGPAESKPNTTPAAENGPVTPLVPNAPAHQPARVQLFCGGKPANCEPKGATKLVVGEVPHPLNENCSAQLRVELQPDSPAVLSLVGFDAHCSLPNSSRLVRLDSSGTFGVDLKEPECRCAASNQDSWHRTTCAARCSNTIP